MVTPGVNDGIVTIRILFIIIPILIGTVHCIWKRHIPNYSKIEYFLIYFLTISVGLQNLIIGHLDMYHSDVVANYIGWDNSQFLIELGKAHMAFGVMGILSFWFRGGWRSATAFGSGLFLLMAGIGHFEYYLYHAHPHKEIIATLAATDLIIAGFLFILLTLRHLSKA